MYPNPASVPRGEIIRMTNPALSLQSARAFVNRRQIVVELTLQGVPAVRCSFVIPEPSVALTLASQLESCVHALHLMQEGGLPEPAVKSIDDFDIIEGNPS